MVNKEMKLLNLGCSYWPQEGWINTDIETGIKGVTYLDVTEQFPFEDQEIDYIFSEHLIEHIGYNGIVNMLSESYRVLKPGGVVRIAMPDMKFIFNIFSDPHKYEDYIKWHFTELIKCDITDKLEIEDIECLMPFVVNKLFNGYGHQFLLTFELLKDLLLKTGFSNITKCEVHESEHDVLRNKEIHWIPIGEENNKLETICVEATKLC